VCAGEARSEEFPGSRPVADKSGRLLSYAVSPVRRYARQGWGENLDEAVECGGSQKVCFFVTRVTLYIPRDFAHTCEVPIVALFTVFN
jgi:hypothetical protein